MAFSKAANYPELSIGEDKLASMFQLTDEDGPQLDARFSVDQADIILHSRGGAKGRHGAVNADYAKGLLLLLNRLSRASIPILGAWVDSATVQSLPLSARSILSNSEGSLSPERICSLLSSRMRDVRSDPNPSAKGGNSTKRIRIATGFDGFSEDLAARLGGIAAEGDLRSMERLPADVLRRATPEYVWRAVQQFIAGDVQHPFGPSTDYDLIADDGRRLPPKAVFGLALSMALDGASIEPRHFTAGGMCFTLLRAAGYQVVHKGEASESPESEIYIDEEWREGGVKLKSHLTRERAPRLARAKKAQYRRIHGRLSCERCGLDPVAHYGAEEAEACIEVHHFSTHVSEMAEGHKTTLDDLQCLCANCHRLVHKILREQTKKT
ncbi:HNH endonuclease [Paraburkholderia fynbosensis]|uniref:HNH endonuclease n=1 Tax=Paraburkholderia fynbosensis TaxID=1200993 RepID=UPI001583BC41|nr:HNH endonuclease [Paraburkholderia fynbosensis]